MPAADPETLRAFLDANLGRFLLFGRLTNRPLMPLCERWYPSRPLP